MNTCRWKARSIDRCLKTGSRILPQPVSAVLVVAISFQLAQLTWIGIPSASVETQLPILPAPLSFPTGALGDRLDLAALNSAHLFGEPTAAAGDIPDTTLRLQLSGLVSRNDGHGGWAVISSSNGSPGTYVVGDIVGDSGGAKLYAVYEDQVILSRAGTLETLRLPRELRPSAGGGRYPTAR